MDRTGNEKMERKLMLLPVAAGAVIEEAQMVALDADGYAKQAEKEAGVTVAGIAVVPSNNAAGAAGDATVIVKRGAFILNNDGSVKNTDMLKRCYISDSRTVSMTADKSSPAGIIIGVETDGIIVDTMYNMVTEAAGAASE